MSHPNYQLDCGWNALLAPRVPRPALQQDLDTDVAIIGAGWTGIAAARRWQELSPGDSVTLLDSSEIGEGNPGRNSGFLLSIALAEDANPSQLERMALCNRLTGDTMAQIMADVERYCAQTGETVELQRTGTYRAAASSAGLRSLNNYRAFLQAAGLPFTELDRNALRERLGSNFYAEGLYSPDCYLAQPAAVIRALAAQLSKDTQLFENTPALEITRVGQRWRVKTPGGHVSCRQLILANNAFAKDLGIGGSRLVAMYTFAGLTPPLAAEQLDALGTDPNWGLLPTHRLGSTLRRTADGRFMIRSMHSYEKELPRAHIETELARRLHSRFPSLRQTGFDKVWGGAVGFTYNGGALWGEVKPNLHISAGCNGGGTVKGTLLGRLLVDKAHGLDVPDVPRLFGSASWMPPEPLRVIGFKFASTLESWQGRHEL
jgi:glycine/D-amino acid oxidase-like deaminating enzyme